MKKINRISLIVFACIGLSLACTKIETGYLSDYIKYSNPNIYINAGVFSTTEALFTDGSTLPLEVEMLEIRNKETGEVATDLLEEHELNMWLQPYDYTTDTTEALVMEKLELKSVPAFEINSASGMVRFNPNTAHATGTQYEFDLRISNVRGTKDYESIGNIELTPIEPVVFVTGTRIRVVDNTAGGNMLSFVESTDKLKDGTSLINSVTKISDESAPGITVYLKALDKNGTPWNWETEEVKENWPGYNLPGYESAGASIRTERTAEYIKYYFPVAPFPYSSWYSHWYMYYHILPPAIGTITPDENFSDDFDPTHDHWANFRLNLQIFEPGTWEIVVNFPNVEHS